jgi:hypothetical protein
MTMTIIDPTCCPTWDEKIRSFPEHSVFHNSAWAKTLAGAYRYIPIYFSIFHKDDLTAALPVMEIKSPFTGCRGVSLPFTDSCPPLTRNAADVEYLFQKAVQYGRKAGWKYIELRDDGNFFFDAEPYCSYYVHNLNLCGGKEKKYAQLRSSTRRNIKKAVKEGVEIRISVSRDALEHFCRLNTITRKKHGLPPQPGSFFQNIYDNLLSRDQGIVVLAVYRQKPIAGAIYLYFQKSAVFKYGASDPGFLYLRPNNLVMWEAVRWLIYKGIEKISFGRTDPDNKGLLQFKRGWGAVEGRINYFKFDLKTEVFVEAKSKQKSSYGLFRLTPVPLLRLLGTLLYRHMG